MKHLAYCTAAVVLICGAATAQQPSPVRVDAVRLEPVQQLRQVTGNVRAVTRSRVAAIEPGQVIEFDVHEGQLVKSGQRLAVIDAARLEIQLRQLEADLSVRQALLAERIAQVELRESDLELILAMQQRGAINPKELSDARLELSVAHARRDQAQRELLVKEAEADLLRRRISDTVITAPFDGTVLSKHTERGEWVAAGSPIVQLVSTGSFDVWLDVPQYLTRAVSREGFSVMVHVDALDRTFQSRANRIVGEVDAASRTFALVVRIDQESAAGHRQPALGDSLSDSQQPADSAALPALAAGMSVTAWIPTEDVSQQLTVHKDAVSRNAGGAYIFVVRSAEGSGSRAVAAPVEVVFSLEDRFVVRGADVNPGDHAVIEGGERLRPGAEVRVVGQIDSVPSSPSPVELATENSELKTQNSAHQGTAQ